MMTSKFSSIKLEPRKRQNVFIHCGGFHLSMASLDLETVKDDVEESFPVLLKIADCDNATVLCNLNKDYIPQVSLDLNFEEGAVIQFYTTRTATIDLTGYGCIYCIEVEEQYDTLYNPFSTSMVRSVCRGIIYYVPIILLNLLLLFFLLIISY